MLPFRRNVFSLMSPDPAQPAAGGGAPATPAPAAPAAGAPAAPAAGAHAVPAAGAPAQPAAGVDGDVTQKPTLLGAEPEKPKEQTPAPADQRKYLLEKAADDAAKKALEGKTDEEVKKLFDEAKAKEAAEAAKPVDPASYKAALKLPQGFELNEKLFGEFSAIAAKAKMSQEEVQKFMDTYTKETAEAAKAPYRLWQDTQKKWRDEVANDKEIGGANLQANIAFGTKFIESLPNSAEVKKALDFTGAGNHPAIIKAFIAAGKMLAEGHPVSGSPGKGGAKSAADTIYGAPKT